MFKSWWQRVFSNSRKSATASSPRRRNRVRLHLDRLEDRLVPAVNLTAVQSATGLLTLTETSAAGMNGITVTEAAVAAGETLTVSVPVGDTINGSSAAFTSNPGVTALTVKLGSGADTLTIGDSTFGTEIALTGALTISGTGGTKTIFVDDVKLGSASLSLSGGSAASHSDDTTTFTNVSVAGAAKISHPGVGDDNVTITNQVAGQLGPNTLFAWGSLSITNDATNGTNDITTIQDTNFAHNVTINNGAAGGNTGSQTTISALHDQTLATIGGNLTVTSTKGAVNTDLNDYNVQGNVTFSASGGVPQAAGPTSFGVEDNPTSGVSGTPLIGGNVKIADSINVLTTINVGQDVNNATTGHPLSIKGNLTVQTPGQIVNLTDLTVTGTASVTLGAQAGVDKVNINGYGMVSAYGAINIAYHLSILANTFGNEFNIQDVPGETDVTHGVSLSVDGVDTITLGHMNASPPPNEDGTVKIGGNLSISGTDSKTIAVQGTTVSGNLNVNLTGVDQMNATFTDTSVAGAARVNDPGYTNSVFTITSSDSSVFNWGSLALTNGANATVSINNIDFAGAVTINNHGGDTLSIQDQAGTTTFGGPATIQVGAHATVNFGADSNNDSGVANALVNLLGKTKNTVTGGTGSTLFGKPNQVLNSNIVSSKPLSITKFTLS